MWSGEGPDDGKDGPSGWHGPPIDPHQTLAPRIVVTILLLALFVEFLFGLAASIWGTTLPSSMAAFFGPNALTYGWLSAHAALAGIIVILGIVLIVFTARLHRPRALFGSVVAFILVLLAALSGYGYVNNPGYGGYVLLMATFFLGAWTMYALLSVRLRRIARMAKRRARVAAGAPPAA